MRRRGPREQDFVDAVAALYEAATDMTLWSSFLECFGAATQSAVLTLHVHDVADHRIAPIGASRGCDAALEDAYRTYYASRNVYMTRAASVMGSGDIGLGERFASPGEVRRSEYFDGFLEPLGVLDAMSACIFREGSVLAKLDFLRPIGKPGYGPEEVAFTRRLMPHLQRAVAIHRRLHTADLRRAATEDALDALAFGVCMLDETGRILFANRTARSLLTTGDGLVMTREERLSASRPAERVRLERLAAGACATGSGRGVSAGGGMQVTRPSGLRPFAVMVAPLRIREFPLYPRVPVAVAFISDTEREITVEALLREIYGLTPAEAIVAKLLVEGLKVAEVVDRLAVSTATVRTHVRRVLEKTGSRGQADLIRTLLAGPASLLFRVREKTATRSSDS